ncbi:MULTISPECIES: hypothetical protein [Mameliella]|jgi:hypothetical protein|uniref:Protein NnrT n=1 Tax=Mameliella alba TaxID=561184 RepID=A0A0B3S0H9_9RHOB|nr:MULTISPECIES: hypothetical protein [Mameliella]KHQ50066.1 hypothetical protein OA50_05403 [Mameliella alba]
MKRLLTIALTAPAPAFAAGFDRPVPQPQTDVAEFWFLVGSIALILALAAVQWLVARR